VGANAGLFTHLIWTLKPDAEIIAFEPLPKMAAKIKAWQARTGARLTIHNQAVSDHCDTAPFYAMADNDTGASLKATDRAKASLFPCRLSRSIRQLRDVPHS
jgi:FkbM family methyltransferase